jgi:methionyl-tRNA formyltransferase
MEMEVGLDTGGVYALADIDISDQSDTTASLTVRLAGVSAELLMENLDRLLAGELQPQPQRGRVIETRKLTKAHGEIAWHRSAVEIERHTRAMWPWPRAWTSCAGDARIQIHAAEVVPGTVGDAGIVVTHDDTGIVVGTGDGGLRLRTVQLAGKPARAASDLRQHPAFAIGARLGGNVTASEEPDAWIVDTEEIAGDSDA